MVSIIIINYHVEDELLECLKSIFASESRYDFEVIVVDNDEDKSLHIQLKKKYPQVRYVPNDNKGFGQGNNVGASHAKGDYLFFLNPDTLVFKKSIDNLIVYLNKNKNIGILAPLLFDFNNQPYPLQGLGTLTPITAVFAFSFINKIYPNNPISRSYWMPKWDKNKPKVVKCVPGTAFVISKQLFNEIGKFDENFFLYFEEMDLCKRVAERGLRLVIYPESKVYHAWGSSTKKSNKNINKIFEQSRFYYFKKHFGIPQALFVEFFLRINKFNILLFFILLIGLYLRFASLSKTMMFIGDQGWFYISARNIDLYHNVPLVGIASSHPWLHQGAYWTYLLALVLIIFHYNPISGGYFTSAADLLSILLMYSVGSYLFSKRIGLLAAGMYAFSPLVVLNARVPYHTSIIPLFTIIFIYLLYKTTQGNRMALPLSVFILGVLYNLELSTILLVLSFLFLYIFGLIRKQRWALNALTKKNILLVILLFVISMFPILIYDFSHHFVQLAGFTAWIGYKFLLLFGFPPIHAIQKVNYGLILTYFNDQIRVLLFPYNLVTSLLLFSLSVIYLIWMGLHKHANYLLLLYLNFCVIVGFFASDTASGAYIPILIPGIIFMVSVLIDWLIKICKSYAWIIISIYALVCASNIYFLVSNDYILNPNTLTYAKRYASAKEIIKLASGKEYNLIGTGPGSQFPSFTMNYQYLTWWLGNAPVIKPEKLKFIISEYNNRITVIKK